MDVNKNYYHILEVSKDSDISQIKKSYYKLSFKFHPDRNKGIDLTNFQLITEAYSILGDSKLKTEYDTKSRWGNNYNESIELLDFEFNNRDKAWDENKLNNWILQNQLNIIIYIDEKTFNGNIEYERWVSCKSCDGDGRDTTSKILIKDKDGNVIKTFEGSDGCDFCDGTGKDHYSNACYFCSGKGKVGFSKCKSCDGNKRILGMQKISELKYPKGEKSFKIESMGHISKDEKGKIGSVFLVSKSND
jgi:DnaJ-class molecular chaperone